MVWGAEKFALQDLRLVRYKAIDDINVSIKLWASEKLSDEFFVPVYNDSLDINKFELLPVSRVNMKPLRGFGLGRLHFSIDMFSPSGK
jgi:hypothetical protein